MIGIGIDTGGTCTDAVIYNSETKEILAAGKTLTTKPNLETGISLVLRELPEALIRQAKCLSLSTTLATNACVENKGARAKLLIIGAQPGLIARLQEILSKYGIHDMSQLVVFDAKAENMFSEPYDPDWEDLQRRAPQLFADCDSIGIVQTFPGANGGRFELTALRLLEKQMTIPITIAYEISKETDFLKVCASTLLNARLIPLISEFMQAVHHVMDEFALHIPLMIVRSDGTLMSEEMARTCPVETLLCGPAASVIGGCKLADVKDALLVDMGGTTTDIAMVRNAQPVMAADGILIGQYRTAIRGLDAQAVSLGGDSAVRFRDKELYLDPVRVIPVSILAERYRSVLPALKELNLRNRPHTRMIHEFYVLQKDITGKQGYTEEEHRICDALKNGPLITLQLVKVLQADLYHLQTGRLEQEGIIMKSGLTPTDIMVIRGELPMYSDKAALSMLSYVSMNTEQTREQICERVYDMVIHKMYRCLGAFLLRKQYPKFAESMSAQQMEMLLDDCYREALQKKDGTAAEENAAGRNACPPALLQLTTDLPMIGIGAPIHVFLPRVASLFQTRAILSPYAHVANALGAIAGNKTASVEVSIAVEYEGFSVSCYSIVADCRKHSFASREEAVAFAGRITEESLRKKAEFQGLSGDCRIEILAEDKYITGKLLVEILVKGVAREE